MMGLSGLQVVLAFIAVLLYIGYRYCTSTFNYWRDKGIKYVKPYPIVGSIWSLMSVKEHILEYSKRLYTQYKNEPYIGIYQGRTPTLLVFDPALIKNIMVKDFQHFTDHGFKVSEEADPLEAKNLFNLEGHKWKEMRAKLTPTFTSGRMKSMFPLVLECSEQLDSHLKDIIGKEFDAKDLLSRYTTDVIGSCAFGIQCNSLKDPNCEFRLMGKKLIEMDTWKAIKTAIIFFLPGIGMKLKLSFIDKELTNFFRSLVNGVIALRAKTGVTRKDFMQLLIEIKEKGAISDEHGTEDQVKINPEPRPQSTYNWTADDITAQATVFFIAGFETSATVMSFALLELAANPEVQEKAHKDITDVLERNDGQLTYQSIQEMQYIDWVLQETMRKYPPVANHVRICTKKYKIPGTEITLEEGDFVFIPVHALQNDEKYFPDPDKFQPERFSNDETSQKNQYVYTPFGEGPRQCIGNRFALMQSKLGLITFLRKFEVQRCSRTDYPVKYDPQQFIITTKSGIWLTVKPRP